MGADFTWLKTHAILLAIVACLTYGAIYGIEFVIAKHDAKTAAIYQTQNTAFQAQVQQQIAQLQAANLELQKALIANQVTEKNLPTRNGSLTAPQTAQAITTAVVAKPTEVTATDNTITMSLPVATQLLTAVQLVPLLQQDKLNLQTQLANETKAFTDEQAAHKKDNDTNAETIRTMKSSCRKSKLKWFGIGFVAGFVSGLAVKVAVVH